MIRRTLQASVLSLGGLLVTPAAALAHGVGGREDLPIPLGTSSWVAVIVIVASFVMLGSLWPEPRLQDGPRTRPLAMSPPGWLLMGLSALSLVALVVVIAGGLVGQPSPSRSLSPLIVYVLLWLIVPFVSAVLGNVYAYVNPWRLLGKALAFPERKPPAWVGVWPAVLAFGVFTWFELVSLTGGEPRTLSLYAIAYTGWLAIWMYRYGTENGLLAADGFTTYTRVISAISPIGRAEGRWVWRGWLRALPVLPQWSGLTAFVLIMIGTVTFDGLSATERWLTWFPDVEAELWFKTLSLVAISAVIALAYYGASWAAVRLGDSPKSATQVADSFAHSLVPIGLAYAFAHYFTLVLFEGQKLYINAGDPFDLGWDLFGTASWKVVFWFGSNTIWWIQLGAIVVGHVVGVVLAHDRALVEFGGVKAVRSQWAMLGLMVGLTLLGLFILAEG